MPFFVVRLNPISVEASEHFQQSIFTILSSFTSLYILWAFLEPPDPMVTLQPQNLFKTKML